MSNLISQDFYSRPPEIVAPELIGCSLYVQAGREQVGGVIVETEAYSQFNDPTCHAYNGKRTKRNEAMYASPGTIYVYLIYGIHYCFNIVCDRENVGSAVLVRAIEPDSGVTLMQKNRPNCKDSRLLASGPGNLCKALGISMANNNTKLGKSIMIENKVQQREIKESFRIGVKETEPKPWRFYCQNSHSVSMRKKVS
jgi:DNA-3-methyladenine glycosylase